MPQAVKLGIVAAFLIVFLESFMLGCYGIVTMGLFDFLLDPGSLDRYAKSEYGKHLKEVAEGKIIPRKERP